MVPKIEPGAIVMSISGVPTSQFTEYEVPIISRLVMMMAKNLFWQKR